MMLAVGLPLVSSDQFIEWDFIPDTHLLSLFYLSYKAWTLMNAVRFDKHYG